MAAQGVTYEITKYQVFVQSSPVSPGKVTKINLWDKNNEWRGQAHFYPDGTVLPPAEHKHGRVILHLPLSVFSPVVDTLRNEKPIIVCFNTSNEGSIRTGVEPAGEEES